LKLLIVDDHALNLKLLRAQLEGEGHEVVDAADGMEALEILEREPVDGVVSDILMPRMDGYRLCMEVRARPALAALPFVLYTSTYNSPSDRELANSVGTDAYISKPAPVAAVLAAINAASRRDARPPGHRAHDAPAPLEPAPLMKQYNAVLVRKLEEKGLELERTHEGLLESRQRLAGLIDSAMDAIIAVDEAHRIVLFNPSAGRMFGWDPEEAIGQPLNAFIPLRSHETHERHLAAFEVEIGAMRRMGPREVMALRADGTEFPIEANISRMDTSAGLLLTAFIRDVTERRQTRLSLEASEAGLRRAQDVARMAHAIVNADGVVEQRSDSMADLLGVEVDALPATLEEWLGHVRPDDRLHVMAEGAKARADRCRVDFEYGILRRGELRWVRHIVEPLSDPAQSTDVPGGLRTFSTLQDITEQRASEERIRQLLRVYAVLSDINNLIVRVADRDELFTQACRVLVETGKFAKAWIGVVDEGIEPIRIMAWAGADDGYFIDLQRRLTAGVGSKPSAIARVLASQAPVVSNDIATDPGVGERELLVRSGSLAFALFPLVADGRMMGLLSIHSATPDTFDEEEQRLLLGLATDIAFALDHLIQAERVRFLANHDALTGLPNRALFAELLSQQLGAAGRSGFDGVLLLDLVRFRRINETLGRRAGDRVLRDVADRLRKIDPTVARVGADVFALHLPGRRSATELAREIEHIVANSLAEAFHADGEEVRLGCRVGAAFWPGDAGDAETMLRNAEAALRRARAAAEPLVFYSPAMNAAATEGLALESRLRRAVDRGELMLHYQPKLRLSDRRICGVEALLRWRDQDGALVPPVRFIPILEEIGLIGVVGQWALGCALADRRGWCSAGAAPIRVAVNVSPLQLNRPDFAAQVGALLVGQDAEALELEITESVIMQDVDEKIAMLRDIRALGVDIAVDDFGTGYSSLAYIARLPISSLKIDRAFVADLQAGPQGTVLVSSIIALAHALQLKVVAEGVETAEQAAQLLALGCDEGQGYLYSRPIPAADLLALLLAPAS
jgi:diguanylate cyclase (GGDEF)-like protein/PAS domain S-box-containing protein